MAKTKRTITRDSVFRDVNPTQERVATETPAQGLPADETRTHQTGVWLGDDEIDWLDNQCRVIQRGGWRGVTRSSLIRALIRAASEQRVDLAGATGEVEIAQRLAARK